jgi:hypothetical protein
MSATPAAIPPNPKRESPPPGIETRAIVAGREAPEIDLPDVNGRRWSLREHLRSGPVAIVFYRGHW